MSQLAVNSITDANSGNTATINGMTPTADSLQGFRNRILNGCMRIDQRNAGVSQTSIGNNTFITDRFSYQRSGLGTTAVFDCQQSTTAPTGYSNSAYLTATTGQTLTTTGGVYFVVRHVIEGFNIADALRNQNNVTLSFWVYASNNGTYSLVLRNSGADRSYATTYTVTTANTWQQITVTIPLNASGGTWNYTNGTGLEVLWTLDASDDVCTASNNAWVSSGSYGASGQSHGKMTTGATFYITGVQLEVGSVATPFERRPYGTELQLCQRYYQKTDVLGTGIANATTSIAAVTSFIQPMRATPTGLVGGTTWDMSDNYAADANTASPGIGAVYNSSATSYRYRLDGFTGLTTGRWYGYRPSTTSLIAFSAEL